MENLCECRDTEIEREEPLGQTGSVDTEGNVRDGSVENYDLSDW